MLLDKIFGHKESKENDSNEVNKIKMAIDSKKNTENPKVVSINQSTQNDPSKVKVVDNNLRNNLNTSDQNKINNGISVNNVNNLTNPNINNNTANVANLSNISKKEESNINLNNLANNNTTTKDEFDINKIAQSLNNEINESTNNNINTIQSVTTNSPNFENEVNALILNQEKEDEKEKSNSIKLPQKEETKPVEDDDNALYIRLDKYEEILKIMETIKKRIRENEEIISKIIEIKKEEDIKLNKWEAELRDINEKVVYIDKILKKH